MPGFKIFNSHLIMLVFCEFIIVQGNIGVTKREKLTNYTLFLSTLGDYKDRSRGCKKISGPRAVGSQSRKNN